MKIKMINKSYDYKMLYKHTMFIYLKDKNNKTVATTFINSIEKLDKKIIEKFFIDNYARFGNMILDYLFEIIDVWAFKYLNKDNFYNILRNNNDLEQAINEFLDLYI